MELIFSNGRFYQKGTNKRMAFINNMPPIYVPDEFCIIDEPICEAKKRIEQYKLIQQLRNETRKPIFLILERDSLLHFAVNLPHDKETQTEKTSIIFECRLLEDLYGYADLGDTTHNPTSRFENCVCETTRIIEDRKHIIGKFDIVRGKSLNNLYTETAHTFIQRNGRTYTASANRTYYVIDNKIGAVKLLNYTHGLLNHPVSDTIKHIDDFGIPAEQFIAIETEMRERNRLDLENKKWSI